LRHEVLWLASSFWSNAMFNPARVTRGIL
jgi:hypothetical protein